MRVRGIIIAVFGLGLVGTIACSRNANQANFIGSKCNGQQDCPAELLCVAGACWEPCNADGTCPNPGEVCSPAPSRACVPGGQSQGGSDDGGGGQDSGKSDLPDGGGGGSNMGDGILARSNLPAEGKFGQGGFDVDDTCVAWVLEVPDGFGNKTYEVHAAALASTNAPDQKLVTSASMSLIEAVVCANGYAYWIERAQASQTGTLSRRKIDGSAAAESIGSTTGTQPGANAPAGHVDDDLFAVDGSKQLRRYDSKTGTLDPTAYGSATAGSFAHRTGNTLYWLYNTNAGSTPWEVWSAQVGSAGAATGVSLPNPGGGPGYIAVGASGTSFFVALAIQPGTLTRVDTTSAPSGSPQQVYNLDLNGGFGANAPVAFSGAFAFANDYTMGGPTAQVMRVNMLDGSKVQVGTSVSPGAPRPLKVSATTVYWLEPSFDGMSTNLMKKPKP